MREAAGKINYYIKNGISFNQETTLTRRSVLGTIKKAKEHGFQVRMHDITLRDAELAIERVKLRVLRGGHGIAEDVIRKRYRASLFMVKEVVSLCDEVQLYDNTNLYHTAGKYENGEWKEFDFNCKWLRDTFQNIESVAVKQI